MSNHVHLAAIRGSDPSARLMLPLNSSFARWLNKRQGRLGPVFAERHRTIVFEAHVGTLIAYIHNNPVRAGIVSAPQASTWTSHRHYLEPDPELCWLDTDAGLRLCGLRNDVDGRSEFHSFVEAQLGAPRNPVFSGEADVQLRADARATCGAPIELGPRVIQRDGDSYRIAIRPNAPVRPRFGGAAQSVLNHVARKMKISPSIVKSRTRMPDVVAARRLALLTWQNLGRPQIEMAAVLGISSSGASQLLRRSPRRIDELSATAVGLALDIFRRAQQDG